MKDPGPLVFFSGLGESSLDFTLLFWISDYIQGRRIKSEILFSIFKVFKENNIENLKQAIAAVGYDADEIVADPVAYAALHPCCKKGSKCDMPEGR